MNQIGSPLVGSYDYRTVALSVLIATSASYAALDLGGRVTAVRGWTRSAWLAGGAAAMGFGIWSMHFTGMLAFTLPVPVSYDWPTVLLSLLAAILASAVALYVASRKEMDRVQALTGGLLMGLGIAGMHYTGMAAMRLPAVCHYSPLLVALSVFIAVIASFGALGLPFDYREACRSTTLAKVISATMMGAAISLMHYTGMMAATFFPSTILPDTSHAVSVSSLGLSGIAIGTFVVQALAVLTSSVDRQLAAQAQELQTSERFRQVAEFLRDVLLLGNADLSEVLFVNRAYEAIWGSTVESLYANPRSWLEGVHPDDRQQVREALRRLEDGESLDYVECRVVRPDGSVSWVRLRARPVLDSQGHPYRVVGSFHEFTKRKLAEEQVKQAENRIRLIIDTIPTIIWRKLPDGSADFLNQHFREYTGLSSEDGLGWGWMKAFHPDDRLMEEWRAALAAGEPFVKEARLRGADGQYRWFLIRAVPLRDEQRNIANWYGTSTDIEDRKRAETEARTLIDAIPQQIWSGPPDGTIDYCNERWRSETGLELKDVRDEGWLRIIHPDDRDRVLKAWRDSVANGTPYEQEERHRGADGTYRWFLSRGVPLRDAEGRILRWYGTNTDIEDRKRADEELRQSEDRIRAILDFSPNWIFLKDTEGRYLLVNKEVERVFRISQEQIKGKTDSEIFPAKLAAEIRANDLKVLREGVTMEFEEIADLEDGRHTSIVHKFPLFDTHGNIYATGGVATDITERKRLEEALRHSEEQYRTVVETGTDAVVNIDEDSKILFVNPATTNMFGYELSELIGRALTMFMPESLRELHKAGVRRYLATDQRHMNWQGVELIGLRKNGEEFPVEISFGETRKQGRSIFTGFIRDITERKRAEEELQQAHERIDSILRSVSDTFILFDRQWRYLYLNDAAIRATGRPLKEVLGRTLWDLFPVVAGTELDRQFHRSMDEHVNIEFDFHFLQPGIDQWWEIRTYPQPEGLAVFATEITERKRADEQLRRLSGRLLRSQDEERRRIARDLHDSTGQDLVALATMLGQLNASIPAAKRKERLLFSDCRALADKCIREVRTLSYVLHPPALDQAGLGAAIRDYVDGFTKRSGIQVDLELSPRLGRMTRDIEQAVFRVTQEALTNIQRHSGSPQAKIRVNRNSVLTLEISDLGRGLSATKQRGKGKTRVEVGVGIPSMQERVKLIGGRIEINSSSHGTSVRVTIPLGENQREKTTHFAG
jgi:PAS domain S-box-containing protein